ncbi:MAG: anthranilate phosphoribosyltransferase [Firmicutes bacterium]|nr:anthranilate phosphoribosyltransferase [Bacillota bacterium]
MILIIDNYDSFTYNLYQYIGELYSDVVVRRNDEITINEIKVINPDGIVISPGPGRPIDSGVSLDVIREFYQDTPILGVCLGHQAIGEVFGGIVTYAKEIVHGKSSIVKIDNSSKLYKGFPDKINVARYHSLAVDNKSFPDNLIITGITEDGEIMSMEDKNFPLYGLQYHPESILTKYGKLIIKNFITEVVGLKLSTLKNVEINIPQNEKNQLKVFIKKVAEGINLSETEASEAMDIIMNNYSTDSQIASFITALSIKGETIEEITGFAKTMRKNATLVEGLESAIDIVGTGGDLHQTFNISTTSAFIIAGAGAKVAKHGNRSVSSKSGSADVLEKLGVKIDLSPDRVKEIVDEVGVAFMFAPVFHKSMRFAATPRREVGLRSVFNILGPLANPAATDYILMGVYDEALVEPLGNVLLNLGIKGGMVVHGLDGLDEVSTTSETLVCEIKDGKIRKYLIKGEDYGLQKAELTMLVGGDSLDNSRITLNILGGQKGPKRDIVVFNSACALYIRDIAKTIDEGIKLAEESIDSGKALKKLQELIKASNGGSDDIR